MSEADQCGCMIAVITHTLLIVVDSCCGRFDMLAAGRTMAHYRAVFRLLTH